MRKPLTLLTVLILVPVMFSTVSSCKKEKDNTPPADNYSVTVFKNQTGNPAADALQAQVINNTKNYTINIYGSFLGDNNPDQVNTVTYNKAGNDTTIYFILDPATHRLQTAYLEVSGVKQNWVIKHDYIAGNDSAITISIYDYNWSANTGILKYQCTYERQNGQTLAFANYSFKTNANWYGLGALGVGLGVAEIVFYGTEAALLPASAGAVLVGAAAVATVAVAVVAVVATVAILTSSNSNAAVPDAANTPYPNNVPTNNPTTGNNNPTQNLPPNPCSGITINFTASLDNQGSLAIHGVTGGTTPYTYADKFPLNFQTSQFFYTNHPTGNYSLTVKDANGCMKTKYIHLAQSSSSITDGDGNQYQTVTIGTQTWLTENLHTTKYMNGDTIATYTSNLEWSTATTGAWCYYGNDPQYDVTYGKLYNWYAVTDSRKVCPTGYHIPTEAECVTLFNNASNIALRATAGWTYSANSIPTNTSGFTALPAGQRYGGDGTFHDILDMTVFWTSTQDTANAMQAKVMWLPYSGGGGAQGTNAKTNGISVRCIKD